MTAYACPDSLTEALHLVQGGAWRVLAGGTDVYPQAGASLTGPVLDIGRIAGLRGIRHDSGGIMIGATTTWSEIAEADLPPALAGLQQSARQIGARQVQNAGTLGGNLCNASPAADGVPPLLTLQAEVELASPKGSRRMAVSDFIQGPRKTALGPDELLVAIHLPPQALQGRGGFLKLGARVHLVISIAMVAARIVVANGKVAEAALAVGACSAVATRLERVEAALLGQPVAGLVERVRPEDVEAHLAPIADLRASADYRLWAATELLRRVVGGLA